MTSTYRLWPAVALLLLPSIGGAQTEPETAGPYDTLIIRNATLIDGTGPARGPVDIVIKKNVIEQVVAADPVSRGRGLAGKASSAGRMIDATGMYVTPGLIDMHMHFYPDVPLDYQYKLVLGHGITTVRTFTIADMGPKEMVAEKQRSAENKIIAPRMYVYPFWRAYPNDPRFSIASEAPQIVREWKAMGVDGVKMFRYPSSPVAILAPTLDRSVVFLKTQSRPCFEAAICSMVS